MSIVPNVRVEDMGHKMGCNGVDNGKLWFDGANFSLPSLCLVPAPFAILLVARSIAIFELQLLDVCDL